MLDYLLLLPFVIFFISSVIGGLKVNNKIKTSSKSLFVFRFCSVISEIQGGQKSGSAGLSIIKVKKDCIILTTFFPLLFISDKLNLVRKINLNEIKTIRKNDMDILFFKQKRVFLTLESGEILKIKVKNLDIFINYIVSSTDAHSI